MSPTKKWLEKNPYKIKEGMIKVAIFYPNEEGKNFDMDYYSQKHMPMAASLFGDNLKAMSIDKGLAGATADLPATYAAIGYFFFEDMATMAEQMGANGDKLRADVPNYTNIIPVLQISEVNRAE
ncbi:MAG: EthD family reductase [Bacteroidota bacterium]